MSSFLAQKSLLCKRSLSIVVLHGIDDGDTTGSVVDCQARSSPLAAPDPPWY